MFMKKYIIFASLAILLGLLLFSFIPNKRYLGKHEQVPTLQHKGFAILELFTSQGCSSCPPADELLGKYVQQNDSNIIALSFHVDYWNRLGWKDPFSTAAYTDRQRKYAANFQLDGPYTPQLVINGQKEMVGSDEDKITAAVSNFLSIKNPVNIKIGDLVVNGDKVTVNYKINGNNANAITLIALVQRSATTNIRAGENNGVKLKNYNIVRDFVSLENDPTAILHLPAGTNASEFSVIIFSQNKKSLIINGAAARNIL